MWHLPSLFQQRLFRRKFWHFWCLFFFIINACASPSLHQLASTTNTKNLTIVRSLTVHDNKKDEQVGLSDVDKSKSDIVTAYNTQQNQASSVVLQQTSSIPLERSQLLKPDSISTLENPLSELKQNSEESTTKLSSIRTPYPESPAQALRKISPPLHLLDDMWKEDLETGKSFENTKQSLIKTLQENIHFLEQTSKYQTFLFGDRVFSKEEYLNKGLRRFLEIIENATNPEIAENEIKQAFDFYEPYGYYDQRKQKDLGWGQVKITGYYEPILDASKTPNSRFYQPLYRRPPDLQNTPVIWYGKNDKDCSSQLYRGKLITKPSKNRKYVCQAKFSRLVKQKYKRKSNWIPSPYYTRYQIDSRGVLKGHDLELCYVDRLDAYLLQIEGSGRVRFPDGTTFRIRSDGHNGLPHHPYSAQILASRAKMSVEGYLRSLPRPKLAKLLNQNLSYVFFEENNDGVNTSMGVEMTPGRTVAMDPRIFPRGSLLFLVGKKPIISTEKTKKVISWQTLNRWTLVQDTGGAIRGPGRIDLFLGEGSSAKQQADLINHIGTFYFLVPKENTSS